MLKELTIQNFGLIDKISLEFHHQLNIFTGETGAGKSILIDALRATLGERLSSSNIRDNDKECLLEAVFEIIDPDLKKNILFKEFLSKDDPTLIIQRISNGNRNKIKINGLTVTLNQLKEIGNYLVDFHGPHDHQMLLSADSHKKMLDRLVNFDSHMNDYQNIYTQYAQRQKELETLQNLASSRERELDLLTHQIKELEQVPLKESSYDELIQEQTKINNVEKLSEHAKQILQFLEGSNSGASQCIQKAFNPMQHLNQIDKKTSSFMNLLNQVQETHEQLISELHDYTENLSFDPQESDTINTQCDIYDDIKRKYGPSLNEANLFYTEAKQKYNLLANLEQKDDHLRKEIISLEKNLKKSAQKITKKRQQCADELKKTIEKELSELGISNVQFEARIEKTEFLSDGQDIITFYISPNLGEDLKPLAEIVSSGEAARVMLALKKALIKVDPIPVLIFDEIDAQIGGRLGTITGRKLQEIANIRQVILITHLPQIACFAASHFKVLKKIKNKRTFTEVSPLNKELRIKEIAKMMSGEKESTISLKHASDLLAKASISQK